MERREPSYWPALRKSMPSVSFSFAALFILLSYGEKREREIKALIEKPTSTVHAAVIQANIGDFEKLAAKRGLRGAATAVVDKYFMLSDQALSKTPQPDFLVWPETAYPSTFRTPMSPDDLARDERIESFVRERQVPLLFGGYDRQNGRDYNAFFMLTPKSSAPQKSYEGGNILQTYRKNILLLFGEYVPFTENSELFQKLFPQVANFGRGVGPEVFKVPLLHHEPLSLDPIICYEALFPDYVIDAANHGSQMIMNITNDSWFGSLGEPELHLSLTIFRSIESRLPELRSTNTGYSVLVLPDGSVSAKTELYKEQILDVSVPLISSPPTLMKKWGDWFGKTSLLLGILLFLGLTYLARASRPLAAA